MCGGVERRHESPEEQLMPPCSLLPTIIAAVAAVVAEAVRPIVPVGLVADVPIVPLVVNASVLLIVVMVVVLVFFPKTLESLFSGRSVLSRMASGLPRIAAHWWCFPFALPPSYDCRVTSLSISFPVSLSFPSLSFPSLHVKRADLHGRWPAARSPWTWSGIGLLRRAQ